MTGNHEWITEDLPAALSHLRELGVTVLENEYVVLERNGEEKAYYVDREGVEEAPQFLKPPVRKRRRSGQES